MRSGLGNSSHCLSYSCCMVSSMLRSFSSTYHSLWRSLLLLIRSSSTRQGRPARSQQRKSWRPHVPLFGMKVYMLCTREKLQLKYMCELYLSINLTKHRSMWNVLNNKHISEVVLTLEGWHHHMQSINNTASWMKQIRTAQVQIRSNQHTYLPAPQKA